MAEPNGNATLRHLDVELLRKASSGATGASEVDRIDRVMAQAALVMIPTGIVWIILGWYGASRTVFVFEQIPYLISGGILGAALTVTGGLLYLGSWVGRVAHQGREQSEQMQQVLGLLRTDLQVLAETNGSRASGRKKATRKAASSAR